MTAPITGRRLFVRFITQRRLWFLAVIAMVAISAAAEIAFPWLLQRGVDTAVGEQAGLSLVTVALAMAGVIVLVVLGHGATLLIESWLFSAASFDLRQTLYTNFQGMPLAELARQPTGTLTHRATSDVAALESGMTELFSGLIFDVLVGIGVLAAMLLVDLRLTALVLAIILAATVVNGRLNRPLPLYTRAAQALAARLAGRLQESIGITRTVRAFGAEAQETARLDAINRRMRSAQRQAGFWRALVTPLWHFADGLGVVAVLGYGGSLVAQHRISIGALVGFMAYMELLAGPITRIGGYHAQFVTCRAIAERIAELLAATASHAPAGRLRGNGTAIAAEHLRFRYPGSERWVLDDVCFKVAPGERVALAGRNGAGKSTVFDLLLRFYQPDAGRILVGGVDLAAWDNTAWRTTLGLMPQETVLFRGTLAENMAFVRPNASEPEFRRALEEAGAAALLQRLPHGLDTLVGERGQGLSGGERQMIGLARLFLRDPAIVLLDEPTSALDGEALRAVTSGLERLAQGRTMIFITHAPELLALADRVLLLDQGHIVADGSAKHLLATDRLFRGLLGRGAKPLEAASLD